MPTNFSPFGPNCGGRVGGDSRAGGTACERPSGENARIETPSVAGGRRNRRKRVCRRNEAGIALLYARSASQHCGRHVSGLENCVRPFTPGVRANTRHSNEGPASSEPIPVDNRSFRKQCSGQTGEKGI